MKRIEIKDVGLYFNTQHININSGLNLNGHNNFFFQEISAVSTRLIQKMTPAALFLAALVSPSAPRSLTPDRKTNIPY